VLGFGQPLSVDLGIEPGVITLADSSVSRYF
jgi:hypothetical protein